MLQFLVPTAEDMIELGRAIGKMIPSGTVIGLVGDLGVGKTTLVQGIAQGLAVEAHLTSPTFTLIKQYAGRLPLHHIDVYRLEDPEEILLLGLDEILLEDSVVVVEWADRIQELLPKTYLRITLTMDTDARRRVVIEGKGQGCEKVMEELENLAGIGIGQCYQCS